ncbi:MAG: hypothetical protein OXC06_15295 [Acidimicrobiaceae bacterium]|nr:hypothetical protein [Acidimicrobiaceae bacterium]
MEPRVWVNRHQPQTLYIAQLLMYFQGGLGLLFAVIGARALTLYTLVIAAGKLVAAYGIANEMRWAYKLGVVIAALPILVLLLLAVTNDVGWLWADPIGLLFDIALLALLLHTHSRSYQQYWRRGKRG